MPATVVRRPTGIALTSRPVLPRHARLRFDAVRQRWVILVPERVLLPDETAIEILRLADGEITVETIIDRLTFKYQGDRAVIATDVIALLQDLADQGFLLDLGGEGE
ncbi:pyrroloquinoline quinone biosynthesis peptide chaperone PqqD [Telmatospirillum siberiense]|uniref:Pyrroloquinoline quinone biosynthesis peptide chaperone PqqD n=1 Tax=Telmatospirillum siberiense TaxID=382514 RepID=A0A2N3PPZ0_9PROT|nr:pyrroloquinoline quinone biosynthesis peptide chaperone PqqD [Telmatospirillum siberiense]PKU22473.1 pyrroloquinoline quinone biosynthesis peptide chaperone PqqD [Telmatospirillum siberiense]